MGYGDTDVALNGPFPRVILSYDAQQRVEVGSESSLHSGGSVKVRAVTLETLLAEVGSLVDFPRAPEYVSHITGEDRNNT